MARVVLFVVVAVVLAFAGLVYRGNQIAEEREARERAELQRKADLAAAEEARSQRWRYSQSDDAMTGKSVKRAYLRSTNQVEFDFPYKGPQRAELALRVHPRFGRDVMLSIDRGQFMCAGDGCAVMVKFGDQPAKEFYASPAKSGNTTTIFINGFDRFLAGVRKHESVQIEVGIYQEGRHTFQFTVEGLDFS